ncbi:hypothetical protein EDC94DRAFT_634001 [Helicostylum pulchrum]|nr:hypothetical protein EDC94DRAFT_634001 [Helicostylum pulchrum]
MSEKYKNLKVKELQELLQKNGLSHTGKKEELIDRLVKHDQQTAELASLEEEFGDLEEFDDAKLALDDIEDPLESVDEKKAEEVKPSSVTTEEPKTTTTTTTTTTAAGAAAEEEEEEAKSKSNFKFTPIVFDKKPQAAVAAEEAAVVEKKEEKTEEKKVEKPKLPVIPTKVTDDAERALERAKRFGIQLNETAKKDIRAQRFGIPVSSTPTTPTTPTSTNKKDAKASPKPVVKGIDPEVLKKRAERFGLAKPTTATATTTTTTTTTTSKVPTTVDPAEEEKKRKRAERFQQQAEAAKKLKAE